MQILSLYSPPVMFWDGTENSTVKRIFLELIFFREAHSSIYEHSALPPLIESWEEPS